MLKNRSEEFLQHKVKIQVSIPDRTKYLSTISETDNCHMMLIDEGLVPNHFKINDMLDMINIKDIKDIKEKEDALYFKK